MTRAKPLYALISAFAISGCASFDTLPADPIPVTAFVNSLKCEYGTFLTTYKGERLNLKGWGLTGTLDLNVFTSTTTSGGVAANLVPYQGGTVSLGFSGEAVRKRTAATTISFALQSEVDANNICDRTEPLTVDNNLGFGEWLNARELSLDSAEGGAPKFGVSGLDYQLIFAVEKKTEIGGGVGITVIPLTISGKAIAQRNDIQTMKIKMVPPDVVVGRDKDGKPITKPKIDYWMLPVSVERLNHLLLESQ